MSAMEIGDENLPPPDHSWQTDPVCSAADLRSPPVARSVLTDLNTSATEVKSTPEKGPAEEEKCTESEPVSAADAEAESWSERTAVITRYDHETHCQLARSFVEELADQVVAAKEEEKEAKQEEKEDPQEPAAKEELKEDLQEPVAEEEAKEEPKEDPSQEPIAKEEEGKVAQDHQESKGPQEEAAPPVNQLQKQKQSLTLPDLVPNVTAPRPPVPVTESESDEYESADEQPLQDTLYLDSTVNPPSSASTPIVDTPGHQLDFDLSTVILPDEATRDASTKDYSLPVVEQAPAECPQPEGTVGENNFESEENKEAVFVKPFDRRRSTAPFSPSSGSDVSNVESEADTLAAQTPIRQPGELDIDFICKFEKLGLSKQSSSESASPTKESKEVEGKPESSPARLNDTVPLEPVDEDTHPADVTRDVETKDPDTSSNEAAQVSEEKEPNVPEDLPPPSTEDPPSAPSSDSVEPSANEVVTEPSEAQTVATTDQSDPVTPAEPEPEATEANPTPSVEGKPAKPRPEPLNLPEEKPIVPKKGYDLSFLDRFDDLENATPSISHLPLLPPANNDGNEERNEDEEQNVTAVETPTAEPITGSDQVEAEDPDETSDSSFKGDCTVKAVTPQTSPQKDPSDTVVEAAPKESEAEDCPAAAPPSDSEPSETPEVEAAIVPKKGYDLSFLDKLEDLEHASPTAVKEAKGNGSKGETAMKESMSATENVSVPSSDVAGESPSSEAKPDAPGEEGQQPGPAKKGGAAVRKPIRPKFTRPPAAAKTDAFEVEFTFDPSEDPFKPKTKLGASPPRDQGESHLDAANSTVNLGGEENTSGNEEDNTTVVESESASDPSSTQPSATDGAPSETGDANNQEEEFRPAQEVFQDPAEFDFLMQHGGCSKETALARQSLFVKFDPLVAGRQSIFPARPSDGGAEGSVGAADTSAGRKSGSESLFLFSPPHPSSGSKQERNVPESTGTVSEPVQQQQQQQSQEQFLSSRCVSDDLVSLSEHKEALKLQELLFQDRLLQKDREIQMKENENQEVKAKLEATVEAQAQMRQIVGEYEKTISQLIAEKEREKANMETNLQTTIKERDQAIEDLKEVERAFSEFHKMYERNRAAAEGLHKNEEALKKALAAYQERLQQEQHKYETLKLHAAQKLEGAQQEMENLKRNLEGEISRVKAVLKKTEMKLASVETTLDQKTKENEELTKLCDELINKLGSSAK